MAPTSIKTTGVRRFFWNHLTRDAMDIEMPSRYFEFAILRVIPPDVG
jgi:hypothetical protein